VKPPAVTIMLTTCGTLPMVAAVDAGWIGTLKQEPA